MKYLLIVVALVTAFVGCRRTLNGIGLPTFKYEVTGSDSFSVFEGAYLVPGIDSTVQISQTSLPWSIYFYGDSGDSAAISVRGYNPTVTPGTLVVTIFAEGRLLDSPNNPDSCVTHQFPGQDTCSVQAGGRLK